MFQLYKEETSWWSFRDYAAVLSVMRRLRARDVLEFGPGASTLALVEGGANRIVTMEDDPEWFEVYDRRIAFHYGQVDMRMYTWSDPLSIPGVDDKTFDLALIDGPLDIERRPAAVTYALARCAAVLVPLEKQQWEGGSLMRAVCGPWPPSAGDPVRKVEVIVTGPPSYAMALVTR